MTVGAAREIATSPDEKRIQVTKPDGHVVAVVPSDLPTGVAAAVAGAAPGTRVALFRDTDQTGIYRVRAFRQNGSWVDRPDETFVVNLDTRESNPKLLDRARWPDRAAPSAAGGGAESESPLTRWEAWHFVGAALVFLLLLESMLTLKLRSERNARAPRAATQTNR